MGVTSVEVNGQTQVSGLLSLDQETSIWTLTFGDSYMVFGQDKDAVDEATNELVGESAEPVNMSPCFIRFGDGTESNHFSDCTL